jgi:hypothetical protein
LTATNAHLSFFYNSVEAMSETSQATSLSRRRSREEDEAAQSTLADQDHEGTFGICRGDAPREDSFPVPPVDWRWGEGTDFVLMSDYSLAASNAINAIFLPIALSVVVCMCSIHAWNLWADNHHRSDFKDYKKNRSKMGLDFERYKRVPVSVSFNQLLASRLQMTRRLVCF